MKKIFFTLACMMSVVAAKSQIGGISASKLANYSATTVKIHTIEFEPAFAISRNHQEDSLFFCNSFVFRFTYGLTKNSEIGFVVPTDVTCMQFGLKQKVLDKNKISAAIMGGANFNFSSETYLQNIGLGGILTLNYTDKFSSDFNFAYMSDLVKNSDYMLFTGVDNGVYIGSVQYILGVNYLAQQQNNDYSENLFLSPGITVEPAKNFLLVLSAPVSVFRKNDIYSTGFTFALTITIE